MSLDPIGSRYSPPIADEAHIIASSTVGVIAHHNDFPIERLSLSHDNSILGSASHDECVKLTDIRDIFDPSDDEDDSDEEADSDDDAVGSGVQVGRDSDGDEEMSNAEGSSESEEEREPTPVPEPEPERKKKKKKDMVQNREEEERAQRGSFFGDL